MSSLAGKVPFTAILSQTPLVEINASVGADAGAPGVVVAGVVAVGVVPGEPGVVTGGPELLGGLDGPVEAPGVVVAPGVSPTPSGGDAARRGFAVVGFGAGNGDAAGGDAFVDSC